LLGFDILLDDASPIALGVGYGSQTIETIRPEIGKLLGCLRSARGRQQGQVDNAQGDSFSSRAREMQM
jgi:hypothetical protein